MEWHHHVYSWLAHGNLLLVWERGRGITLTCTLTFVIGAAVDQVTLGTEHKARGAVLSRKFCAGEKTTTAFFLPCEFVHLSL